MELKTLSNKELGVALEALVRKERATSAEILLHLGEVDARQLYVEEGYSSLFAYCTRKLRYSEPAANRRIASARAVRKYPALYKLIVDGELSLTTTSLIAGTLNDTNKDELIKKACGKSRTQVEELLCSYHTQTKTVERVRPVTIVRAEERKELPLNLPSCEANDSQLLIQSAPAMNPQGIDTQPKPEKRYVLNFSVSEDLYNKIQEAKSLLSSKSPQDISLEQVFELLTDEYLKNHSPKERAKRREAKITQANAQTSVSSDEQTTSKPTRYIPAKIRDEVFIRDNGCCTYVSPSGVRCQSRHNLQIDHITPVAREGKPELANLRLTCVAHNRYFAEQAFGKEYMRKFVGSHSQGLERKNSQESFSLVK